MTIWLGERAQLYFNDVIDARDIRIAAVELRDHLRTAESSQRGFLLTGNEIYLAPYDTAKTQRCGSWMTGRLIRRPPPGHAAPVAEAVGEKIAEMDHSIALKSAGRDAEAMALLRSNRGKTLMDEINVFLYGVLIRRRAADHARRNSNAMHRCCAEISAAWSSSWWCSWWLHCLPQRAGLNWHATKCGAQSDPGRTCEDPHGRSGHGAGTRRSPADRGQSPRGQQPAAGGGAGADAVQCRHRSAAKDAFPKRNRGSMQSR